MTQHTPLDQDY